MKYWLFDGSDVVGPFTPQELAARPGFAPTSLVCPENTSDKDDSWKMVSSFEELAAAPEPDEEELDTDTFDKEMDTLLKERSPLAEAQEPVTEPPAALQIPQKPVKSGPIENYFNNMQGGDLGNILGIPDPNENSDMNLARALAKQFNKTTPPADKVLEKDPFDEFTEEEPQPEQPAVSAKTQNEGTPVPAVPASETPVPQTEKVPEPASIPMSAEPEEEMELTVHGAKTQEIEEPSAAGQDSAEHAPEKEETQAPPNEPEAAPTFTLPVVGQAESELPPLPQGPAQEVPLTEEEPTLNEPVSATAEEDLSSAPAQDEPQDQLNKEPVPQTAAQAPIADAAESAPQETKTEPDPETTIVLSSPDIPAEEGSEAEELTHPSAEPVEDILVGALKVKATPEIQEPIKSVPIMPEVNQVRPRLKPTPEIQQFLTDTQNERIAANRNNKKAMAALAVLVALLAMGILLMFNHTPNAAPKKASTPASVSGELVPEPKTIPATDQELLPPAPPPAVKPQTLSAADKALSVVQNYTLSGGRGTVAAYLDRLYRDKLSQGYTGNWSAEPLHKNAYIVKYRLTKTRMEPIVYVFQADVSKGTLTGALNNIALDLLGKIQ